MLYVGHITRGEILQVIIQGKSKERGPYNGEKTLDGKIQGRGIQICDLKN